MVRMRRGLSRWLAPGVAALAIAAGATTPAAQGGSATTGIYANQLAPSFADPVYVTSAPGFPSLLFVVEQRGTVQVLRDGAKLARPFLDIRGRVTAGGEQGLLSIAFHPRYRQNRKLYAYFTNRRCSGSGGCAIEVAEFKRSRRSATRARARTHRRVIAISHPDAANHNGGTVAFGPDRKLWLATGDGGGGGDQFDNARDRGSLLGKLLRIDPRKPRRRGTRRGYRIPPGNPFADGPGRDEIWSIGLRNPFRFSFDPVTGLLGIGDVGQQDEEEVNVVTVAEARGANFGWPQFEGTTVEDAGRPGPGPLIGPDFVYPHPADGPSSVTGGVFLRDPRFEGVLDAEPGTYVFADFFESQLRRMDPDGNDDQTLPNAAVSGAAGFGTDTRARIHVASLFEGRVYRLDPAPAP
jgi:glucose/arabinose dehydrogenase